MTLQRMLEQATFAYHRLMVGELEVEVMVNGSLARFQRADANKLLAYIASLEAKIAGRNRVGAIAVKFS